MKKILAVVLVVLIFVTSIFISGCVTSYDMDNSEAQTINGNNLSDLQIGCKLGVLNIGVMTSTGASSWGIMYYGVQDIGTVPTLVLDLLGGNSDFSLYVPVNSNNEASFKFYGTSVKLTSIKFGDYGELSCTVNSWR